MIPIPQYPLYSATLSLLGGSQIPYYLDEDSNWGLSKSELQKALNKAKEEGINARALVVINPGNPTGQVLSEENMVQVIEFCLENNIVLLADEVYQENIYIKERMNWNSFKKIYSQMKPKSDSLELISFHSVSKGFLGECGQRGGYMEVVGFQPDVLAQIYKLSSVILCPNTSGQIMVDLMVNPPKKGEESYEIYIQERDQIIESLKRRATKLTNFLNTLEGVSCNPAEGAMYAFPQIRLPPKAVEAAQKTGKKPDAFYAIQMLDATGVCVVPGSGFGQKDGTFHFRTTFLPPESQIDLVMERMSKFHSKFMETYR